MRNIDQDAKRFEPSNATIRFTFGFVLANLYKYSRGLMGQRNYLDRSDAIISCSDLSFSSRMLDRARQPFHDVHVGLVMNFKALALFGGEV